jgi:N-acetylmuramoyl-L-alanine amidase
VKLHWLLPSSFLIFFMLSSPADAAKLQSWRFDANRNLLEFNTDDGVQPKAQLIFNPTRLVIDLPGTEFGRPQLTQSVGGAIRSIRVGQFEKGTARIVVELAPGYTLDPQQVKFQGTSPQRWAVQLPTPQVQEVSSLPSTKPGTLPNPSSNPSSDNSYSVATTDTDNTDNTGNTGNTIAQVPQGTTRLENVTITRDGFFIRTTGGGVPQIRASRGEDGRTINFFIYGATLSSILEQREVPINRYGVSSLQFSQLSGRTPTVSVTMRVDRNSPNWQASLSGTSGLVLLPDGGVANLPGGNPSNPGPRIPPLPPTQPVTPPPIINAVSTIESVELSASGTQLIIRGDQPLSRPTVSWDKTFYKITIPNSKLASRVQGPSLTSASSVLRVRLQQQDPNTVSIFILPASGTQFGNINQLSSQLLALDIQRTRGSLPPLPLPTDPGTLPPPVTIPTPGTPNPTVPRGKVVIVVDPGHGGKDSGAPGIGGLLEKDVILPIGRKIAAILEQNGYQAVLTRDSDYFVELQGRVDIAESKKANLFISIHANSIGNRPDVNGLETYYYDSGYELAKVVHENILRSIGTIKDRGTRKARFYVLRKTSMPSILVETGYMTGREDNPKLGTSEYQNRMAEAIAKGIIIYLKKQ